MDFHSIQQKTLFHLKDPWTLSWIVSGLVAVLVPVITWHVRRRAYYVQYGYAIEEEYNERQYEQQQEDDDGGDNDDDYYTYEECSWFNVACKKRQYYYATAEERERAAEDGEAVSTYPGWYLLLGGYGQSEDLQKWEEENTGRRAEDGRNNNGNSSASKVVYTLHLFLFTALLVFGAVSVANRRNMSNLQGFLVLATVLAFTDLLTATQGLIATDERMFEDSFYGWVGQTGVLMVYSDFWIMMFCFGHLIAMRVKDYLDRKAGEKEETGSDYNEYKASS